MKLFEKFNNQKLTLDEMRETIPNLSKELQAKLLGGDGCRYSPNVCNGPWWSGYGNACCAGRNIMCMC